MDGFASGIRQSQTLQPLILDIGYLLDESLLCRVSHGFREGGWRDSKSPGDIGLAGFPSGRADGTKQLE